MLLHSLKAGSRLDPTSDVAETLQGNSTPGAIVARTPMQAQWAVPVLSGTTWSCCLRRGSLRAPAGAQQPCQVTPAHTRLWLQTADSLSPCIELNSGPAVKVR